MVNFFNSRQVDQWRRRLIDALYPPRCRLCGDPGAAGIDLCHECRCGLPWNRAACPRCAHPCVTEAEAPPGETACPQCRRRPTRFDTAIAPLLYEPPAETLIHHFKFRGRLADGRLLGMLLARAVAQRVTALPLAVVPIPSHRGRLMKRGFEPTWEIARWLRRELPELRILDALEKRRATPFQSALPARQRRDNIRGAFVPRNIELPRHVAVLDDVVTTGATAEEAARILRRAGVERLDLWAVARTPQPEPALASFLP